MLFPPPKPLEKFIDQRISLQKICRTSLIALRICSSLLLIIPSENLVFSPTTFRSSFFVHIFRKVFEQGAGVGVEVIFNGMAVDQTILRATTKSKEQTEKKQKLVLITHF